jgi:hypothetical protein
MEHLSDALRAAAADPPPSGIDLDRLIVGERRARQRRWFAGGAAALAVLSTAGVVTATVRAPGGLGVGGLPSATETRPNSGVPAQPLGRCTAIRPTPTGVTTRTDGETPGPGQEASPPAPTEPTAAAVLRLSTVLNAAVASTLPTLAVSDAVHPNCEAIQFEPDLHPALYYADFHAKDERGAGTVVVMVHYRQFVDPAVYEHHETRPDGTWVGWNEDTRVPEMGDVHGVQVSVLRPDGTFLTLLAQNITGANSNAPTRATAPATVEQLIAIGTDPGLTLYP